MLRPCSTTSIVVVLQRCSLIFQHYRVHCIATTSSNSHHVHAHTGTAHCYKQVASEPAHLFDAFTNTSMPVTLLTKAEHCATFVNEMLDLEREQCEATALHNAALEKDLVAREHRIMKLTIVNIGLSSEITKAKVSSAHAHLCCNTASCLCSTFKPLQATAHAV
jgi:hypothetical protein